MDRFASNRKKGSWELDSALGQIFAVLCVALLVALAGVSWPARAAKQDTDASRAAFLQVYRVLTSPRCQNCHPAGDAPLQGDDSHVHIQNVKRGKDGHGVYGMRCDTCHQARNLPGAHMPPGNPKWSLPSAEQKMVFVGRSPAELCGQIKDRKQNGGRTLAALLDHVANDDLVGWGWNPGDGRTLPPLTRAETAAQMKIWIEGGAACPER
jgi:mono/diheme cytochrome c family protein